MASALQPVLPPIGPPPKPNQIWLIFFALLSSNLFALFIGWIFEFLSLRGVVDINASRIALFGAWASGVIILCAFAWGKGIRAKGLTVIGGAFVLAIAMWGLDVWAPKAAPVIETLDVTTELTIDRSVPWVRQVRYPSGSDRIFVETGASDWLVANNPKMFLSRDSRDTLINNLVSFSLISFLRSRDAQLWEGHYHRIGSLVHFEADPNRICQAISEEEVRSQLRLSRNLFSDAPLFTTCCHTICLPVSTTLRLTSQGLSIDNKKYKITFEIEGPSGVNFQNPGNGELTTLPNGEARFETRAVGIEIRSTYFKANLSEPEFAKYKEWGSGLVSGAMAWFEK